MNKIVLFAIGLIFICGVNPTNIQAQSIATAGVFAIVVNTAPNAAQINYVNGFSQNIPATNIEPGRFFQISSENATPNSNIIQNIASFLITGENKSSFSVSLPSHPITLTNPANGNTIQVSGWKSDSQPGQGAVKKNVWVVNLGASLKMGSVNDKKAGEYTGTYPVTMIYN